MLQFVLCFVESCGRWREMVMCVALSVMVFYRLVERKGNVDVCCSLCYGFLQGEVEGGKWLCVLKLSLWFFIVLCK